MSYDYSSESQRLELPNPYKVDNFFLLLTALVLIGAGVAALVMSRQHLAQRHGIASIAPLVVGVLLLGFGVWAATRAMKRLRFFFGRGLPVGLAPELQTGVSGKSKDIDGIKGIVRQGGLAFPEPTGALNGLLYNSIPRLIVAPAPLQRLAQQQFHNTLVLLLTLVSFLVAWAGLSTAATAPWIGLFYFLFSFSLVLKPIRDSGETTVSQQGLILLVVVAIVGPVAIGLVAAKLPNISWLSLHLQTLVLLIAALIAVLLFFAALLQQLGPPPAATTTCEQMALNINTQPSLIIGEFDRLMQQKWTEKIPNRRYARIDPVIDATAKAGNFQGEIVEETQPMPTEAVQALTLTGAFTQPHYQWLALLDLFGFLLALMAALIALLFVSRFDPSSINRDMLAYVTLGLVLGSVSVFCFKAASSLWGRFDFVSDFVWIELSGSYATARLGSGNNFTHLVNTQSDVIKIDAMTMRVWMARMETVVFGKEATRRIAAMWGLGEAAKSMAAHLAQFAQSQSMVVTPSSEEDLRRIAALGAMEKIGRDASAGGIAEDARARLEQAAGVSATTAVSRSQMPYQFCSACGAKNAAGGNFCSACGQALNKPGVSPA